MFPLCSTSGDFGEWGSNDSQRLEASRSFMQLLYFLLLEDDQ